MIHELATPYTRNKVRLLGRQAEHEKHVMQLDKKRARMDSGSDGPIKFMNEDLDGVQLPNNDALVIILRVRDYDMKRSILVEAVQR